MAVASIDEVLDFVHDDNLKNLLTESKEHHETLGNELHSLLSVSYTHLDVYKRQVS